METTLEQFLEEIKALREKYEKDVEEIRKDWNKKTLSAEEHFLLAAKENIIDLIKSIEKTYNEKFEEIKAKVEVLELLKSLLK